MMQQPLKNFFLVFGLVALLSVIIIKVSAQTIKYSSTNVFVNNPDRLQMISGIGGNHHLLSFIEKSDPEIFIFSNDLQYKGKIKLPYKFPVNAEIRIVPFENFYYLYVRERFSQSYVLWKIDANGRYADLTSSLRNLLLSQRQNIKLSFQLLANENQLWMIYHTAITDLNKNTLVIVQMDSLLNILFTHKVIYDFKREQEKLQQETIMFGKFLLVLKTAMGNTSLELMKVNIATGYTIRNTFYSSGYLYAQPGFSYNNTDSSVTVFSILVEPRITSRPKQYVFLSRLNKILVEQTPFAILKSLFLKNTGTNFLLVSGRSKWARLRSQGEAIRFSLLDEKFNIMNDSLIPNNKDRYTIRPEQYFRFSKEDKDHLLVAQQFFKNTNGILMVHSENGQLVFTDIRVNDRYKYLLSMSQLISQKGVVIPYTYKKEAGLIRITVD